MPMFFFTPYDLLLIPALILAVWAQAKVSSAYRRFSKVVARSGLTGAQVAQLIMRDENVGRDVEIEMVAGNLTDHYDPIKKTLRLSEGVYHGNSVAALGIAAHEVGHAIQHARGYAFLQLRTLMYPAAGIGSKLAIPLFFLGMILSWGGGGGQFLMTAGIWLFTAAVAFTVVTLPVEFNASRRALRALANGGYVAEDELPGVRKVLGAAAMTYVAAAAMAVLQLLRLLAIANSRR